MARLITEDDVRKIKDGMLNNLDFYSNTEYEDLKANSNFVAGLLDFQDALIAWINSGEEA